MKVMPSSVWAKVREMKKGHWPNGTSFKTVVHFSQLINERGKFRKFDYGARKNMKVYG